MGRHYSYRPGSFYRVDDRTGFPQRAERTRKQWNNLIVDEAVWEPRQPQDLVKGVKDQQSVQDARPLAPAQFVGPKWTTTTSDIAIGSYAIPLASLSTFQFGDQIAIMTNADGGSMFYTTIVGVGGSPLLNENGSILLAEDGQAILIEPEESVVAISSPLPATVSSGSQVWNLMP